MLLMNEAGDYEKLDVLMIGGASGCDETSISRQIARYYNVDLVRVDDFQMMLEAMTTAETPAGTALLGYPALKSPAISNVEMKNCSRGESEWIT